MTTPWLTQGCLLTFLIPSFVFLNGHTGETRQGLESMKEDIQNIKLSMQLEVSEGCKPKEKVDKDKSSSEHSG